MFMRRHRDRDRLYLLHMRDAGKIAIEIAKSQQRSRLDTDLLFQLGLVKAVELMGEAAYHLSDEIKVENPQIAWRSIINMRHVLVHHYWDFDADVVWDAVQNEIPSLIPQLQLLIDLEDERRIE